MSVCISVARLAWCCSSRLIWPKSDSRQRDPMSRPSAAPLVCSDEVSSSWAKAVSGTSRSGEFRQIWSRPAWRSMRSGSMPSSCTTLAYLFRLMLRMRGVMGRGDSCSGARPACTSWVRPK
ncbi:hypothetical protein D3C80_1615090 [compost metagenome]